MHPADEECDKQERRAKHRDLGKTPSVGQGLIFPGPQASVPEASPFTGI